ncbi:hypothetical protein GCM10007874_46220 [Labrys miyagiensis]|uniref:Uncharacterized protein n=1 Tax=Labrys miyagiensis TaxID=346912 RepID=A0ABQ6CN94_9HYPH|nr:hypothetical protein GCM10007874_46220 [Labrys miyagiensis]
MIGILDLDRDPRRRVETRGAGRRGEAGNGEPGKRGGNPQIDSHGSLPLHDGDLLPAPDLPGKGLPLSWVNAPGSMGFVSPAGTR